MRFVQGWDTLLLGMLRQAEQQAQHGRVVLSTYPPGYQVSAEARALWQDAWLWRAGAKQHSPGLLVMMVADATGELLGKLGLQGGERMP